MGIEVERTAEVRGHSEVTHGLKSHNKTKDSMMFKYFSNLFIADEVYYCMKIQGTAQAFGMGESCDRSP